MFAKILIVLVIPTVISSRNSRNNHSNRITNIIVLTVIKPVSRNHKTFSSETGDLYRMARAVRAPPT